MVRRATSTFLVFALALAAGPSSFAADQARLSAGALTNTGDREFTARAAAIFQQIPPVTAHYPDLSETSVRTFLDRDANYEKLLRKKLEEGWFAALVATSEAEPFAVKGSFDTWRGLVEFLAEHEALVEVWALEGGGSHLARRIPAHELAKLKRQRQEQPTVITVTYREPSTGSVVTYRVEFGFHTAEQVWAANEAYRKHRMLQLASREILGARNDQGLPDAFAQWEALQSAVEEQRLVIQEFPAEPWDAQDLLVAFEYKVDDLNNFRNVVRAYRDQEIRRHIVGETQSLILQGAHETAGREVFGYRLRGVGDELERVRNPLPGRDVVELRVCDPDQPDVRKWHVLEFGEPELIKQSALAHFSLVNAYLEKHRKTLAMKQANWGLIVEPIIAGLNIGGGLAGVSFPLGAAARLAYDVAVVPWLIADVPNVKQMRNLLQLLAAKANDPELKTKPAAFLDRKDLQTLRAALKHLTDADVADFLQRMSEEDLRAMLRIAKMQRIDAKLVNLLTIISDAGKVSGWTDEPGLQRDVFNNIYFSMTGEISINFTLAVLAGHREATPLSGISLHDLAHGNGPAEAWLQYLNLTVDFRAVANTLTRLTHRRLADKELKQPFPYAPRLSDLAAYEIRIFGFPLLMFYKRGLIRADSEAYENDYAYGLLGRRIVEHFPNREDLEAEIRAGRVVPLGYVRVPAGRDGWKETDLAVFAHRIPHGKRGTRTALVLYGLKAYREHSELIGRERRRFREFEQALQEGGVIEQWLEPPSGALHAAHTFEPRIHAGPAAAEEIYEPLLANLLELRRASLRESWELPLSRSEQDDVGVIRGRLAAQGINLPEGNPLEGVDRFSSSFIYRRNVGDDCRSVRVTLIPGRADISRESDKAAEARQIEEMRRDAAAGKSAGVVLLNQVIEVNGRLEIGPLLTNRQGQVIGAGVTSGVKALDEIFHLVDRLPVVDRARLRFNRFAATVVELDADGDGTPEKVFLTIEFPLGDVEREWTNPLSGERETLLFSNGQWRKTFTDQRIVELDYDAANIETRSRTYRNRGCREAPRRAELLEETRTLEVWFRDLSQPGLDPYRPVISKLRVNYVTGQTTRETYGLFPLPIEVADDQYLTRNRYTQYGLFESASVFENRPTESDDERSALDKVLKPATGRERFRLTSTVPNLSELRDASAGRYQSTGQRTDLTLGLVTQETVDLARFGRKVEESWVDSFDDAPSLSATVRSHYDEDFHHGLIPVRTETVSTPSGDRLTETKTAQYDPLRRRLTAVETDYTGAVRTNTWDYRWANPVQVDTALRRTLNQYNRDGTSVQGTTTSRSSGETVHTFSGQYDPTAKAFRVTRRVWHRPEMLSRQETNLYSARGRLMATRLGDRFEVIPRYATNGREEARQTSRRDPVTGGFTIPHREEDDYHWNGGERDARVRTWLEGIPHDEFRTLTDAEGRVRVDGLRQWPQVGVRTIVTFDGASERVTEAKLLQNGQVRATHRVLDEVRQPDGRYELRVEVVPFWGLVGTNRYLIGDLLGRALVSEFENGDRARVVEWFADSPIPKVSESTDRHGQVRDRWVRRPNAGRVGGLPYDQLIRYKLSPWGEAGLAQNQAVVRGTEISLFSETADAQTWFDLAKPFETPRWAMDPHGHLGVSLAIAGTTRSNVTAVFRSRFREWGGAVGAGGSPERVLEQEQIDLLGLFYHKVTRRVGDRTAAVLEERTGKIDNPGPGAYSESALFEQSAAASLLRRLAYRYEPGWLVERAMPQSRQRLMIFTRTPPAPGGLAWSVNDTGWREWPTVVQGLQAATESDLETEGTSQYLFRRLQEPSILRDNPHLPGVTNVWTAWTRTELSPEGETLFQAETIYDVQGMPITSRARKVNSRGDPATRITYQLPPPDPETWERMTGPQTGEPLRLSLAGPTDLSTCDFIAFYVDARAPPELRLNLRDSAGNEIPVTSPLHSRPAGLITFWPVNRAQVSWLPGEVVPARGAAVGAPAAWAREHKVFVVSVPELAKAGLEVQRVAAMDLVVEATAGEEVRISPLYRLAHAEGWFLPEQLRQLAFHEQGHSSGVETFSQTRLRRSREDVRKQRGWSALLQYNGHTVAAVTPSLQPPYYPVIRFTDHADPDSPRPLYALAADDGRFLEYYQTIRAGDAQVYTVASGFETPKLEVSRAAVLDDEISPGVLAFGRGYDIAIPMSRGGGGLSTAIADLQNRCVASVFTLAGDRLTELLTQARPRRTEFRRLTSELGAAQSQAEAINKLPVLARALLPRRPVPWAQVDADPAQPSGLGDSTNVLGLDLKRLATYYPKTELIPTAPGTEVERYVDTVREGALIELAVKLRELSLAKDLLTFYYKKSQGGTNRLLASYDASNGASLVKEPRYERPSDAGATAEAQLAIAQAAFCLGVATSDQRALEFGKNLVSLVLADFRPRSTNDIPSPRGIAETSARGTTNRHGVTLWPKARSFSLKSNARAYLLFARIEQILDRPRFETEWEQSVIAAAREQADWLRQRILPHVQRTGVVPKGLFEIQDVHTKTTALAVERWTAADDWLTFLEAADQLGIDRDLTRCWLDNLARVHGVTIDGIWGLDWSVALRRPDAISPELTVKFARVASQLEHHQAADFARRNLDRMRQGDQWPVVKTTANTNAPLATGQGFNVYPTRTPERSGRRTPVLGGWPEDLSVYAQLMAPSWLVGQQPGNLLEPLTVEERDITQFVWTATGFYLAMVGTAGFWWCLSSLRKRRKSNAPLSGSLVPDAVMQKAEERWAKRVLGLRLPAGTLHSRYSNGAIEQNFHMQLRAIYKLVLEWRRLVRGWPEDDDRLVEDATDEWLNGMDEFAVMVGVFSRWVVKAGKKDGRRKPDVLEENEDSNHIWSRLVMYFSEWHVTLLGQLKEFKAHPQAADVLGVNEQIELVLRTMGARARPGSFDARAAFDVPGSDSAFDLLVIQLRGATLPRIADEMERKLDIPREHFTGFIRGYRSFKEREQLFPIHPYLLEAAKVLPHVVLMGLVALIWYNRDLGGLAIYPTLRELAIGMALDWRQSIIWAAPLFAGYALSVTAYFIEVYRHRWRPRSATRARVAVDATISSIFVHDTQVTTPAIRTGRRWNPVRYRQVGWILRAIGLVLLVAALLRFEPPSFATFMFVKGLIVVILLVEAGGILVPIAVSRFSMWLEDRTTANPRAGGIARFINQLNLVPTRPASLLWLSIRYHFQPSVPTGGPGPMLRSIAFYLVFSAIFFLVGGYMYKQALEVWFQETYRNGRDLALVAGGFLFWNTMYLLRFGLFMLLAAISSALVRYPLRVLGGLTALCWLSLQLLDSPVCRALDLHPALAAGVLVAVCALMIFEPETLAWLRKLPFVRRRAVRREAAERRSLEQMRADPGRALGIVYMSGDDLSFHKLTPDLLMARLGIMRELLNSGGLRLLAGMHRLPDDATLRQWFQRLYELEKKQDVTLWHPIQLVLAGQAPDLRAELGLNLPVENAEQRAQLLAAWHIRRWLVTMMSTAGHAQDTAINLVDVALRLAEENLGPNIVFYLIQNKYDDSDKNRPSQLPYDQGELGQREKLARLLRETAPGSRAYNINDWTPFGFKAGGLVGMDLVYEESLKLTNILVLDRNANAHDLDSVVADLKSALSDPGMVIVIPGRSTTNTLTPIGQGSQLVEEGQRAMTRGVMFLGGTAAETLGTGWGNIQAVYYGRVQKALCDPDTPTMPLTTPGRRSAPFGDRFEGMIGFGPHAVGISEDIWGVTQAAHNALALGYRVSFAHSRTLWHKIRESWSHAEWFSAFPRWSGGYLQMMLDPIMQRINEDGPLPVFAKELRANGGRFFLGAPSALLSILLMPLAIIWDASPFVQILILLWNLGLIMNQVLTALGLVAYLESTGFNRVTAAAGIAVAGLLIATVEGPAPFAAPLLVLGCLCGGFAMGLGRWLYYRGRDIVLFGPQLVIHALGQIVRQSLEFVLSGASANDARSVNIAFRAWAGPREDRPTEGYQNIVNLRTVVWGVGLLSLCLNLFALTQLDFLNVLLLLPSLMFSVSTLIGPFLAHPKRGHHIGWSVWIPKILGWASCFGFYCLVAWLVAQGGWLAWLGLVLSVACFGRVLLAGLRYCGYPRRLRRLTGQLADLITGNGVEAGRAREMANHIARSLGADVEKTRAFLQKAGLSEEQLVTVEALTRDRLRPFLRRPMTDMEKGPWANSRFACEFSRSFVLGLFTFIWFFIVPIPGLLAFTAPAGYQVTIPLASLLGFTACVLGAIMAAWIASLLLERLDTHGLAGNGLAARIDTQYRRFQTLAGSPGRLTPLQTASLYALFTDAQTHLDQRGYAYARRTVGQIRQKLDAVPLPDNTT